MKRSDVLHSRMEAPSEDDKLFGAGRTIGRAARNCSDRRMIVDYGNNGRVRGFLFEAPDMAIWIREYFKLKI